MYASVHYTPWTRNNWALFLSFPSALEPQPREAMSAFYYIFILQKKKKKKQTQKKHAHKHTFWHLCSVLYIISCLVTPTFIANYCLPFIRLCFFSIFPFQPRASSLITICTDSRPENRATALLTVRNAKREHCNKVDRLQKRKKSEKTSIGWRVAVLEQYYDVSKRREWLVTQVLSRYWFLLWLQH